MTSMLGAILLLSIAILPTSASGDFESLDQFISRQRRATTEEEKLRAKVEILARQLMMQQFYVEEQTRSQGASGLKRIRLNRQGSRPYLTPTYGDQNFAAMHNHANYDRTIGLGELVVVLNGVEFRTRHLDYKMKMKSQSSTRYGLMEDIPLPEVPPAVSSLSKISDQIAEMKEWFRAFKDQNYKVRDYRPYFKPVLCYMEGMWTNSDQDHIEEPFDSDRHHLDAKSWLDMQEKTRFTAYTGAKDILENYAFLPTTVMSTGKSGSVVMAQWNFKISCHPLSQDVATARLLVVEDIKARMSQQLTWRDYFYSRAARFRVTPLNKNKLFEKAYRRGFLDELMEEIPGMDNYPADVQDDALDDLAYPYVSPDDHPKNVGYFHRWYRSKAAGAMGLTSRHRSFGDENVFMAMNTQDKVAGVHVERCKSSDPNDCKSWTQKWSYAIPLEIIYLTPLTKWNPYKIKYKGKWNSPEGKTVTAGRSGESAEEAYDGINDQLYYLTPAEFYADEVGSDPADTVMPSVYVLDHKGNPREVAASGHRVLMNITGVGVIRQRYPIVPLHEEGGTTWKHMESLMDIVLEPRKHESLLRESVGSCTCSGGSSSSESGTSSSGSDSDSTTSSDDSNTSDSSSDTGGSNESGGSTSNSGSSAAEAEQDKVVQLITNVDDVVFKLSPSSPETKSHTHYVVLTKDTLDRITQGEKLSAVTDTVNGHKHDLIINVTLRQDKAGATVYFYNIYRCDGTKYCADGHERRLKQVYPTG